MSIFLVCNASSVSTIYTLPGTSARSYLDSAHSGTAPRQNIILLLILTFTAGNVDSLCQEIPSPKIDITLSVTIALLVEGVRFRVVVKLLVVGTIGFLVSCQPHEFDGIMLHLRAQAYTLYPVEYQRSQKHSFASLYSRLVEHE